MGNLLILCGLLTGVTAIDALAQTGHAQRLGFRSVPGMILLWLASGSIFGVLLAIMGHAAAALVLTLALAGLFTLVSNAKCKVLGEPLVFTDLGLFSAVFKHPQFYIGALTAVQRVAIALAVLLLPVLVWLLFRPDIAAHLTGLAIALAGVLLLRAALAIRPWSQLAVTPELSADVRRHGLIPVLLLYRHRWQQSARPSPPAPISIAPLAGEVVIIVQCESFADPVALFGDDTLALPGLAQARARASLWGNLMVSGFGAYTMRTEYGVLFGRDEEQLGFRQFDPYLTALQDTAHALPAKLAPGCWNTVFVHPHDLRFYNREQVLGAGGFAELVGPEAFAMPTGRYVPDAAITDKIRQIVTERTGPTAIFAVTIENHGPWSAGASGAIPQCYLDLVHQGDKMLADLMAMLEQVGCAATLVFYGDHRPSIPGSVMPGGERHTPYVIVRFNHAAPAMQTTNQCRDLSPAQLHHAVLDLMITDRAAPPCAAANGAACGATGDQRRR